MIYLSLLYCISSLSLLALPLLIRPLYISCILFWTRCRVYIRSLFPRLCLLPTLGRLLLLVVLFEPRFRRNDTWSTFLSPGGIEVERRHKHNRRSPSWRSPKPTRKRS
ncbi:hypothetical protein PENSPDRAFT_261937 [Peniophora sp. CONT]|nr:hypothetical protein PENSPDRAFT_261937 [Peniophora sp. CONT]